MHRTDKHKFFQSLNIDWLQYIHGQKSMSNLQRSSVLQNKEAEPPADNSQPIEKNHCFSAGNGNENEDNDSKTSGWKSKRKLSQNWKSKKAETLSALEKDFSVKLRLKNMEIEMKRRNL